MWCHAASSCDSASACHRHCHHSDTCSGCCVRFNIISEWLRRERWETTHGVGLPLHGSPPSVPPSQTLASSQNKQAHIPISGRGTHRHCGILSLFGALALGTEGVSGIEKLRKGKMNHDKNRGSLLRCTGCTSHSSGPPPPMFPPPQFFLRARMSCPHPLERGGADGGASSLLR